MNLLEKTTDICKKHNIKPARSKGQNFLINDDIYDRIVESANLQCQDTVLEVGPGLGFLTEKLAAKAGKVIAVELDDKLVKVLGKRLEEKKINNVEIIHDDILKVVMRYELCVTSFKVVANLPYNITSIFLRKILSTNRLIPNQLTLMLQKEVAERITAKPGKMSKLAVSVQFYADAKILFNVPKTDFWPEPKVDSAVIQLKIKNEKFPPKADQPLAEKINERDFFRLIRIGFSARRKKLKNNLAGGFQIKTEEAGDRLKLANLNPDCRAQDLSVADWVKLLGHFTQNML
jgi:16S rRNA (adenine1518-N6/adenine1519-N6)-dimethyltransferase